MKQTEIDSVVYYRKKIEQLEGQLELATGESIRYAAITKQVAIELASIKDELMQVALGRCIDKK